MLQRALHAAAVDNKLLFTELLLDHGADVDALDASGQKPIDLAVKNKCNECVTAITNKLGTFFIRFYCYLLHVVNIACKNFVSKFQAVFEMLACKRKCSYLTYLLTQRYTHLL